MKFTKEDFEYEALHQGKLFDYGKYIIRWSTTKDNGFIKICQANTSMEDDIRFNIKTGRQITCNDSKATIDTATLDVIYSLLVMIKANIGEQKISLIDSAVVHINNCHTSDLKWEKVNGDKFNKFILAPKKKGE